MSRQDLAGDERIQSIQWIIMDHCDILLFREALMLTHEAQVHVAQHANSCQPKEVLSQWRGETHPAWIDNHGCISHVTQMYLIPFVHIKYAYGRMPCKHLLCIPDQPWLYTPRLWRWEPVPVNTVPVSKQSYAIGHGDPRAYPQHISRADIWTSLFGGL